MAVFTFLQIFTEAIVFNWTFYVMIILMYTVLYFKLWNALSVSAFKLVKTQWIFQQFWKLIKTYTYTVKNLIKNCLWSLLSPFLGKNTQNIVEKWQVIFLKTHEWCCGSFIRPTPSPGELGDPRRWELGLECRVIGMHARNVVQRSLIYFPWHQN